MRTIEATPVCVFCAVVIGCFFVSFILKNVQDDESQTQSSSSPSILHLEKLEEEFCKEDRAHVQDMLAINMSAPTDVLVKQMYKLLMKPVQTNCEKMSRIGMKARILM